MCSAMRAKSREELYQMVCEAAVKGAKFTSTTIFLAEQGNDFFTLAATAGPNIGIIQSRMKIAAILLRFGSFRFV